MILFDKLNNAEMPQTMNKEFEKIPAGKYTGTISECTVKEDMSAVKLSAKIKIVDGNFKNRVVFWNTMITDETSTKALGYIKRSIHTMSGAESTNGDVVGAFQSAEGNTINFTIAYVQGKKDPTKEYMQIYVDDLVMGF
jgi:hypothetical protein